MADQHVVLIGELEPSQESKLCALPLDVLCIIMKKLSLKDRLLLELVNKSHQKTLRQLELWQEVNIAALQAFDISEEQFLQVLVRLNPRLQRGLSSIRQMAKLFGRLGQEFCPFEDNYELLWSHCLGITFNGLLRLMSSILSKLVPSSIGRMSSTAGRVSAIWMWDQINLIPTVCNSFWKSCFRGLLALLKDPLPVPLLCRLLATILKGSSVDDIRMEKKAIILDLSGAEELSAPFVAASVIALSAAGCKVKLKMVGYKDASFSAHSPLLRIFQCLSTDCALEVKVSLAGSASKASLISTLRSIWEEPSLGSQKAEEDLDQEAFYGRLLVARVRDFRALTFTKHEHGFDNTRFVEQVLCLVDLRSEVAAVAGGVEKRDSKAAHLAGLTLVITGLATIDVNSLEQLRSSMASIENSPVPVHGLVFLNCNLSAQGLRTICQSLEASAVKTLSIQQSHKTRDLWEYAATIFDALSWNKSLRSVELDFPLQIADLERVEDFLTMNESGVKVVIHQHLSLAGEVTSAPDTPVRRLLGTRRLLGSAIGDLVELVTMTSKAVKQASDSEPGGWWVRDMLILLALQIIYFVLFLLVDSLYRLSGGCYELLAPLLVALIVLPAWGLLRETFPVRVGPYQRMLLYGAFGSWLGLHCSTYKAFALYLGACGLRFLTQKARGKVCDKAQRRRCLKQRLLK